MSDSPLEIKVEGNRLIISVDVSPEAVARARVSSTGKSKLVASTGGFTTIKELPGMKLAVNVTAPLDR